MFARRALTLCLVLLPVRALAEDDDEADDDSASVEEWWKHCERKVTIQEGSKQVLQFKNTVASIWVSGSLDLTTMGGRRLLLRGVDSGTFSAHVRFVNGDRSELCVKVTPAAKMSTPQPNRPVPPCEGAERDQGTKIVSLDFRPGELRPFAVADWRGVTATPPGIVEVSARDANHLIIAARSIGQTSLLICCEKKLTLLAIRVSEEGGPEHLVRDLLEKKSKETREPRAPEEKRPEPNDTPKMKVSRDAGAPLVN